LLRQLPDHGEQDLFLLDQVRFELGAQHREAGCDLLELGVAFAMHADDLGDELADARQLLPQESVVHRFDVVDERRDAEVRPGLGIRGELAGGEIAHGELGCDHLGVETGGATRVAERPVAVAAVVEAVSFERPCRSRVRDHQFGQRPVIQSHSHRLQDLSLLSQWE
jgi:hypothetical protein